MKDKYTLLGLFLLFVLLAVGIVAAGSFYYAHQGREHRATIAHSLAAIADLKVNEISKRKRMEEALRKANDELEERIKERTADLTEVNRTLRHLLQSSDHDRQLIAYEIHDGLAQELAGAIMQFQSYDHLKGKPPQLAAQSCEAGMTVLQQGHCEVRRLIAGVRPPILDESGVVQAIAHLVYETNRDTATKISFDNQVGFDRLSPIPENAIYRITQEGLTNACQHSKSEQVRVCIWHRGNRIRIEIRDWGTGFDTKTVQENRFGLEGIRQRVRLLGGKSSIRSATGRGTCITV